MAPIRSCRDLEAWKKPLELAEACHRFTDTFPRSETFGLAAHIRKSAVSNPSHVAEGHTRRSRVAFANFIGIAMGSQAELETQIELARRLGLGKEAGAVRLLKAAAEVGRILHGLRLALGNRAAADSQSRAQNAR